MSVRVFVVASCCVVAGLIWVDLARAQRSGMFNGSPNDSRIAYTSGPLDNVVDRLNKQLEASTARLAFRGRSGYLESVVEALKLPIESQLLVFSNGSLQGRQISPDNPRAIFFSDDLQLGWVRDADVIELAAQDANRGVVFYTLDQEEVANPRFERATFCLGCHMTGDTFGVPGLLMFSSTAHLSGPYAATAYMDHRMPVSRRFGGWFVTGTRTPAHQGNVVPALDGGPSRILSSTDGLYDDEGYLVESSDVAALMVFSHQVRMINLLTRASWEAKAYGRSDQGYGPLLRAAAADVVDGLLFVDETPLDGRIQGGSGFAEHFSAAGPRDSEGRSLRHLDLTRRLVRYPCSYLIYSRAFDGLPASMKSLVYERLWEVLSGAEDDERYRAALTPEDRRAIVEILQDTKPDLPAYFKPVRR